MDEPPPARSFTSLLAAGLLGGALVGIVVLALALAGVFQRGDPVTANEIASLKAEVAGLSQSGSAEGLATLGQQVSTLEKTVGELSARPPPVSNDAALAELQTRIGTVEQAAAGGSTAELEKRVAELGDAVTVLRNAQPADGASVESVLQPLSQQVEGLSTKLQEVSAELGQMPREDRVAAIEAKLGDIGTQIDMASALAPAVAADAVAAALDAGRPFANELAALGTLGLDVADAEALAPAAATGLRTLAQLRSEFDELIAATEISAPISEDAGPIDRLFQSARGLVEVRPIHPTEGTDPAAVVARIRGALAAGDLRTALAEWGALPDGLKSATAGWQEQAKLRLKADDLVASVRADALARLGTGD